MHFFLIVKAVLHVGLNVQCAWLGSEIWVYIRYIYIYIYIFKRTWKETC